MKVLKTIAFFLSISLFAKAQQVLPCYTTEMYSNTRFNTAQNSVIAHKGNRSVYRIPVVVHVIHDGVPASPVVIDDATLPEDNIPDSAVFKQMKVLNEDYNRQNPDAFATLAAFQPVAASADIRFELAVRDPNGNPTNGIDRVFYPGLSHAGYATNTEIETVIKPMTIWNPANYLNIWVLRFTESTSSFALLGYAQFPDSSELAGMPSDANYQTASTDGLVINTAVFGTTGSEDVFDNHCRTLTHEMGHALGLRHIWGDGDCTVDDFVGDTPDADGSSSGCDLTQNSCGGLNMVQNYMDYSNGSCQNLFTQGQVARMNVVLEKSPRRRTLMNSPALSGNTAVNEILKDRFVISPNPSSHSIQVYIPQNNSSPEAPIQILNLLGETVYTQEQSAGAFNILPLDALQTGIYFVKIGNSTQKFIKE